ncbi:MAG TPA: porin [Candidatus Anaerobiospirillum pullistercoris]|uniref:Porin n=1 Tax=Candidatus Anaerobiospirillum pullistercoris TaxID=2838452 RepID=A0A9D2B1W4_9GAMM|nr:porin [Candidatus Anaerobiospirillum pullistercoris]
MKKSFLALAVAALAATSIASTASATTVYDKDGTSMAIYGRVQSVYYSEQQSGVSNDEGSFNSSARLGVDVRTPLTSGIAAFAKAEWEGANGNNKNDEDDGFDARYLWVGLDFGQFGQVKVGKFEEAIKYAIGPTDHWEDAGCTGLAGNDDRREGVVQYQWSGYGVDAFLSYAFAKDNEHLDGAYFVPNRDEARETVDIDYSVSAALGYTSPDVLFGPIGIRAGFLYGKFADGDSNIFGSNGAPGNNVYYAEPDQNGNTEYTVYDDYTQYAVSAFWGSLAQGPYVAAVYQQREFAGNVIYADRSSVPNVTSPDYTVKGYEFTCAYTFANGLRLATGYEVQELDYDDDSADVKAATVPVLALWRVNPNFDVWAEARFDAGTDDDENGGKNFDADVGTTYAEDFFALGIRYNF